jgi:hypothetical protein
MKVLVLITALLASGVGTARPGCKCRPVPRGEVPNGANMIVIQRERTVKQVRGRVVFWSSDQPVEEAIVELFPVRKSERDLDVDRIANSKERDAACMTGPDGRFCFAGLAPGSYVLRAGAKYSGFNYAHIKLNVVHGKVKHRGEELKLELTLGT